MSRYIIIFLLVFVVSVAGVFAAKNFVINDSAIDNMCLQVNPDGSVTVTLVGNIYDDQGQVHDTKNLVLVWDDMPAQCRVNLNNAMRLLSQQYNSYFADENTPTWEDR